MGSLLVVTGPPGSGKSTTAAILAERMTPSALVDGDEFFRFLRNGRFDPWEPESSTQNELVTSIQAASADRYRAAGYHTVFDGVLGPWFLDRFAAEITGPFDYAVLLPPLDTCLERIDARIGHGFGDLAATRSLHAQFTDACRELDADQRVDSSLGAPGHIADVIEERRGSGRLQAR